MNPQTCDPRPPASRWDFTAAIGSVSALGLASGLTLPLVSVRLSLAGASDVLLYVFGALPALGTLAIAPVLPRLALRLGARNLLLAAMLISCLSMLVLLTGYQSLTWVSARLLSGAAVGTLFALGETRILELSTDRTRGRWTALYASCLTACQLLGPALLALLGVRSSLPMAIAVGLHCLAMSLVLLRPWGAPPVAAQRALGLPESARIAWPLVIAVIFFAMFDSVALALLPVYGLKAGFNERLSVLMASVVLVGDTCLQVPLGWAADKFGRRAVHGACGLLCAASALLLWAAGSGPPLWLGLFVMGAGAGGIYTLAIVRIGDLLGGPRLLAANAHVSLLWGLGGLCGPLAAGAFMQIAGTRGLFAFVSVGAALFLFSNRRRARGGTPHPGAF